MEEFKNPDGTYDGAKALAKLSSAFGYTITPEEVKKIFEELKNNKEKG